MLQIDLDRAFPETPAAFSRRVEQTLLSLKEEPMKKFTLRAVALTALLILLLAGIAYAAIQFGQEWYYDTRFPAYQEHQPEKHQAIMDNLQKDIAQEISGPAAQLVEVRVLDVSWADTQEVMTLSMVATPRDPKTYELYSLWEIDADGALVGEIDPNDEESRLHHWLWTPKGHGLPQDVMVDPAKQLLLVDLGGPLLIGDSQASLPKFSFDGFTTQEGPVMAVLELDLKWLDPERAAARIGTAKAPQGMDEEEYQEMIRQTRQAVVDRSRAAAQGIAAHTDEEGLLALRFPFTVQTFENDAFGEPIQGEIRFTMQLPAQ